MKISGNTILITGGGSGIGRGLAEALQALGNQVIIAGRRKAQLEETAEANPGMKFLTLDIEDRTGIRAFAGRLAAEHPDINVLVNNAGIMRAEALLDQQDDLNDAEAMVTTNLLGPIRLTAALLPLLRKQPHCGNPERLLGAGVCAARLHADLLRHQGGAALLHSVSALSA
jgi:uncharacterized oxidoreductase